MKIKYSNCLSGLTLTELLISSVIVGIVLMGVVSIDSVVAKKRQSATADNLLALNSRAVVTHIIKSASRAIGYGTEEHLGILIGSQVGDESPVGPGTFCIEQDVPIGSSTYNQTVLDQSDDSWVCYTLNPADHNVYTCQFPYEASSAFRGAGRCSSGEVIGQAMSWLPTFEITKGEMGNSKLVFTINITSRFNPSKPKSTTNPEATVTFSSSPPGHSI